MVTGQRTDAAERSASIVRAARPEDGGPGPFVEGPGPSARLRVVVELEAEVRALRRALGLNAEDVA